MKDDKDIRVVKIERETRNYLLAAKMVSVTVTEVYGLVETALKGCGYANV